MQPSFAVCILVAFAGSVAAQSFDLHDAHGIVHDDHGTAWAIGRDYKASLTAGGVTFVPALGSAVPTNRALTLCLAHVDRGALRWWDRETSPNGDLHAAAHEVTIAHGAFVERYEARASGVEQSFVFERRPAGHGDLVVRCHVQATLQAAVRADGTVFFHDGAVGGVTVGAVTGIDARGWTCRGSLQLQDGGLDLRLPAAFVDAATYPLTLDPLLATGFLLGDSFYDEDQVAAAWSAADGNQLVAWRRTYSYFDQDVLGQRVASNGALVGGVLAIAVSAASNRAPSVCYVHGRSRHVACWMEAPNPLGPWTVRARPIAAGGVLGTAITVSGSTNPNGKWLATSGDRSTLGTKALLVWATPIGIAFFGHEATTLSTCTLEVSPLGGLTASAPANLTAAIGSQTGDTFSLPRSRTPFGITALVAHSLPLSSQHYVYALDYNGAYLGQKVAVGPNTLDPTREPVVAIDGDGTDFLVGYRDYGGVLQARQITWTGTAFTSGATPTLLSGNQGSRCAVGFLGERFLVAWTEASANPFDNDVRGVAVKADGTVCSQTFTVATVARPNAQRPDIAPQFAGAGTALEALLSWNETNTTTPFGGSVVGQRYAAMVGVPPVTLSPGCGNGGTASTTGPFAPGNESFAFQLSGGDPTAPYAILSLNLGAPPVLCGCELTDPLATVAMLSHAGGATFPFLPWCDPQFLGTQIEFQWLLYGAAASPCPLVPTLVASNRVLVTLQP